MAVDEQFIPSDSGPGTKGSIHFQVALVDKSDPHSTRTTTQLVEKHNYWWVTNSAFSAAYFAHKARTDQAAEKTRKAEDDAWKKLPRADFRSRGSGRDRP